LITHYGDIKRNTLFSEFLNIHKKCPITKHIQQFQNPSFKVKKIIEDNFLDLFMGYLKEIIQLEMHVIEPESLEDDSNMARKFISSNNMKTIRLCCH
jgi:hypothetical protein